MVRVAVRVALFDLFPSKMAFLLLLLVDQGSTLFLLWILHALAAKRFHDRDKRGWWTALIYFPIIGALWGMIELGCLRGSTGGNRFGPDPLQTRKRDFLK